MEYNQVVQKIAACGLDCSRCADYENGRDQVFKCQVRGIIKRL